MPGQRPTTPCYPAMLLMLLTLSWLPSGGALSLAQEHLPAFPGPSEVHSSPNASRLRELRKGYEDFLTRLRGNQTWEDSNPDLSPATQVQILTPKLTLGPGGHLHLRIPPVNLTKGLPAASRLHRALLRLSLPESRSWDVTRLLQRHIGSVGVSGASALGLHLLPPSARWLAAPPSAQLRLELHWRPSARRGRRSAPARARDSCPLGEGRCCRLQSLRVSLEDLGWSDWVIAPRELDVRVCSGACPSQFRLANRHAQLVARLHRLKPGLAPAPCCVPSSYEPVVLLHRDSEGRVSLTPYEDLVANDCHCL
ncbi:growth/differentiation factor 15 [Phyllostomus hastatus]|uniref:growth/differentiation factor 15 n=1 Tax=Phyllostomus hastatus TaxID=9423 RepID=UPI001E684BF0|nr:growth/differentiation factor 15 [Phyllostomus hastatus]